MWCDLERDKYYVGSHGGNQSQALKYKCGNKIMKRIIKKRRDTCKKRILEYCYVDDRQHLYDMEERYLKFYDVKNNPNFYNHKNAAVGSIRQSSSMKGKKMSDVKPGWVNPNKGKTVKEICGFDLPPSVPPKPFTLTIKEPNKEEYQKRYRTQDECIKDLNLCKADLRWLCVKKHKKIQRVMSNTKHTFKEGTEIYFKYENNRDEISPEELKIREEILSNHRKKQIERQKAKGGLTPIGQPPKPFTVTIYRNDGSVEKILFRTQRDFYENSKSGMRQKLTESKIVTYLNKSNEKSIFNLGDVLIYNEDDFEIESYNPPKLRYSPFLFKAVTPCGKIDEMLFYSNNECVKRTKICEESIKKIRKMSVYLLDRIPNYSKHSYPLNTTITIRDMNSLELIKYYRENKK
jgi:hypothetical protein